MVCVAPEYRLLGSSPKELPVHCVEDAKSAMRWVRAHAEELGIDPDRIAAGGASAGGHLAAFVGMVEGLDDPADDMTVSARANAMVLYNPTVNNGPGNFGFKRIGDRYLEFSPAHNATEDDPPASVFIGTKDSVLPVEIMEDFRDSMEEAGVRCDLHVFEGAPHSFWDKRATADEVREMTKDFFLSRLAARRVISPA